MAMQYEAMFEAPANHEASHYNHPYSNPEFENEWEATNAYNPEFENEWEGSNGYNNPEFENEWEATNAYNPEFENEWEGSNGYNNPEFENEWEATNAYNPEFENEWEGSNSYNNPEFENEWEAHPYSNPELQEGEYFFKKAFRTLGRGFKSALKLAKPFAPILAGKLAALIPGVGLAAAPLAAKLTGQLLKEGEMEAAQMEMEFFGTNEAEAEVANSEVAHEAALTEFLAAQAAEVATEAEAEAAIAATLPITITIMGGKRALRPVMPAMTQATGRLTKLLRQQGPAGKQLLRTIPTIQRRTVATLKAAARAGQPINSATAVKAMAATTNRVLSNPQTVQKALVRNVVLRERTAPPHPRRLTNAATPCPKCGSAGR